MVPPPKSETVIQGNVTLQSIPMKSNPYALSIGAKINDLG